MKRQGGDVFQILEDTFVYWNCLGKKINISRILFGMGLLLIGISKLWKSHNGRDTLLLVVGLSLLLLKTIIDRIYTERQMACIVVTLFLGMLIFLRTGEMNPFTLFMVLFSMKGIKAEGAIKILLVLNMVFFAGTIALCKMGIIYDDVYYFTRPGQILARHSYGLGHPNQVFLRMLMISIILLACIRGKYHKVKMLLVFGISVVLYKQTDSRSGFLCILLLLAVVGMLDISRGKMRQMITVGMISAYAAVVMISVVFLYWNGSVVQVIDRVITGRISLARKFLDMHSFSMLGVNRQISDNFVVDNSYVYIMIHYGILFFVLYVMAVGCLLYDMYRKKMYYEAVAVVIVHIYAFIECVLINPAFNFVILYLGGFLMNHIPGKRSEGEREAIVGHNACL